MEAEGIELSGDCIVNSVTWVLSDLPVTPKVTPRSKCSALTKRESDHERNEQRLTHKMNELTGNSEKQRAIGRPFTKGGWHENKGETNG